MALTSKPPTPKPLDIERLFVDDWDQRTGVRPLVSPQEEDPMAATLTHLGTSRVFAPSLPLGRPAGRRQPSAAVRRLRAAVAIVAVAAVGTLLGAGSLAGAEQPTEPARPQPVHPGSSAAAASHVVQPGDTLWSLARRLQPDGDVRPLVVRLRARSGGGGALVPGQRIHIGV